MIIARKKVFRLFACCILTEGIKRSTISDLQRHKIFFIPNALLQILTTQRMLSLEEIKESYDNKYDTEIHDYFSYLTENELGFYCDNPENFPEIELHWERPEIITNSIIDIDERSSYDIERFLVTLQQLRCKNIEFRIYGGYDIIRLQKLVTFVYDSIFRYISIIVKFHESMTPDNINALSSSQSRIQNIVVFDSVTEYKAKGILFTKQRIDSANCCGIIGVEQFSPNLELFTESQRHNTCLNKKLSVDTQGFIRNCPSMVSNFGHIDEVDLKDVVTLAEYQKYWKISKNQIDTCKVCEFRHVCTDCRAFTTDANSQYAKPSKCSYNPYTNTW